MPRPKSNNPRSAVINVRLTKTEKADMEANARRLGIGSISEYVRHLHGNHIVQEKPRGFAKRQIPAIPKPSLFQRIGNGRIYCGDSLGFLNKTLKRQSVDLIMTSPPFGLVHKKAYGNEDAHRYVEWFKPFAAGFKRVLKPNGSLVIDIGGAWKPGIPCRSLYHFELLINLCEEFGFYLCQEHYWWNPSKLPTPAEWVNVRRIRVKDAVNCVWWLSLNPFPKANNKRVLAPYSESMQRLLKNGCKPEFRPSGHYISNNFMRNNGGSVPPNLLAIPNTESQSRYQVYCKRHKIKPHPARFPASLPEYFIRMLTNRRDLVVDPFAGSCVTGAVCAGLDRRWACCDVNEDYLKGALGRFERPIKSLKNGGANQYKIFAPNALPISDYRPIPNHGGRRKKKTRDHKTRATR